MTLKPAAPPVITPFELLAFDVETTGADLESARIVAYSLALLTQHADGRVTEELVPAGIVNPGVPISSEAALIHGLTDERVANGQEAPEAVASILNHIHSWCIDQAIPLCAFNARFDLSVLAYEARRYGIAAGWLPHIAVIDPMLIDRQFDKYRPGRRQLPYVCRHYDVPFEDAHDPQADAVAAGRVAFQLLNKFPKVRALAVDAVELHHAQILWAAVQAVQRQEHLRESDPGVVVDAAWPLATGVAL